MVDGHGCVEVATLSDHCWLEFLRHQETLNASHRDHELNEGAEESRRHPDWLSENIKQSNDCVDSRHIEGVAEPDVDNNTNALEEQRPKIH